MKICPHCHYHNREGYMFCEDCGEDLTPVASILETGFYKTSEPRQVGIALQIQGSDKRIPVPLQGQTVLGRHDADRTEQPDIDLTAYDALERGVSAVHAAIRHSTDGVQIVDMGSTNGTYVNGRRLVAHQHYILHDGDEIRLGRLVTRVHIGDLGG